MPIEQFDFWNQKKQILHAREAKIFFHEREVWFCNFGINVGHEQNGGKNFLRPIIIAKKFNQRLFWGIPLTKRKKSGDFYMPIQPIRKANSTAILSQMRLMDVNRLQDKMGMISREDFSRIKKAIRSWLN